MLFYYQSWMFYNHFIDTLYHFLVLTYWHSAKCQLLFFPCFLHRRKSISDGVQLQRNFTVIFYGPKEEVGPWLHLGGVPRRGQPTRARQEAQARRGGLCPPRVASGPPLCSINTPKFQKPWGRRRNIHLAAAESRTTRSNLDTISDGVHHLHWCLSDDAWVVLCRTSGP